MRLISSELALEATLALSASSGLTLSELARATGVSASAIQRVLEILLEDGLVERTRQRRSMYRLHSTQTVEHVLWLALSDVPPARAMAIGAGANPAIEFVARQGQVLVVVMSAHSTAIEQSHAAKFLDSAARRHGLAVRYLDHDDVRREIVAAPELRTRMARSEVLHGDLDRTFPDRSRHAGPPGHLLHHPHPKVRMPSQNRLRSLAKRHRVADLELFGSSVRADFRADSDVDVLVRFRSGVRPSLRSLVDLERDLEATFGRDVDIVREETLRPELRQRVQREAVPLL